MNWPRWNRATLTFLVIPLVIVSSCAGLPDSHYLETNDTASEVSVDFQASYHFLLGYLAELRQDHAQALKEYREALAHDPNSAFPESTTCQVTFFRRRDDCRFGVG